tara:strand:- start:421 stop:1131 length:711 start_codon:yes stop_codon:yes gene_type:complete
MKKVDISTIDENEGKKFSEFYNEWWDLDGPFKPLHKFNKIRLDFIINQISEKPLKDMRILDIGCGGGILCEPLARMGGNVFGIDTSKKAISIAKRHAKSKKLKINYFQSEIVNFKPELKFDIITCMEVLEHVNNTNSFINSCCKLLKDNGKLIGSTINKTIDSYFMGILFAENILNIIPKGTHEWKKFVSPNKLKIELINNNFSEINFKGSFYNPYSGSWRYSKSIKMNYFFSAVK